VALTVSLLLKNCLAFLERWKVYRSHVVCKNGLRQAGYISIVRVLNGSQPECILNKTYFFAIDFIVINTFWELSPQW
jgi:hypothetical protein